MIDKRLADRFILEFGRRQFVREHFSELRPIHLVGLRIGKCVSLVLQLSIVSPVPIHGFVLLLCVSLALSWSSSVIASAPSRLLGRHLHALEWLASIVHYLILF